MMHPIVDMTHDEIRLERASNRAQSLRKKRAEFQQKSEARSQSRASRGQRRSQSAAPPSRDSAKLHGGARVATRSCMVKGLVDTSADMPAVAMWNSKTFVSPMITHDREPRQLAAGSGNACVWSRLGGMDPWQVFIKEEDASLQRWLDRELPVQCWLEPSMDDTTDEGSVCAGHSAESSEWGTPPLSVLPDKEDMEALKLPIAAVDVPSSPQDQTCMPDLSKVPPPPPIAPPAPPSDIVREVVESDTCTEADEAREPETGFTELEDDWVVVSPPEDSLRQGTRDLIDGRHPRNLFAKKPHTTQTAHGLNAQERTWAIDWSQGGIPQEVKTQIIKANMGASHRSVYAKEPQSALPFDVLRAQNIGSNHRQRSTSRSRQDSVPRSQSKSLLIKQPTGRR